MMIETEVAVIGGGLLGTMMARQLRRWQLDVLLIEAAEDVCTGISRANSAIVYSGCDNQPGSLKARLTVAGNARFDILCEALDVPFARCGSLMVARGPNGVAHLRKKMTQGRANGVPGLELLSAEAARRLEPMLSETVQAALYAPTCGVVDPWQLALAAYENALANGAQALLRETVVAITRCAQGYLLTTTRHCVKARAVVNCAGISADRVQDLVFPARVRLQLDAADYLILDRTAPSPRHVLFAEEETGKGVTAVPTVQGNLLLASPPRPLAGALWATSSQGLHDLAERAAAFLPAFAPSQVIRSFAAVRPNPYLVSDRGRRLHDLIIERPAPDFISLIGVKTPGLTCAALLTADVAERLAMHCQAAINRNFSPYRAGIHRQDGPIICQCGQITEGAVREAICRGARTVDGVKHRVGSGLGHCQGSRCRIRIEALLKEQEHGTV